MGVRSIPERLFDIQIDLIAVEIACWDVNLFRSGHAQLDRYNHAAGHSDEKRNRRTVTRGEWQAPHQLKALIVVVDNACEVDGLALTVPFDL